MRRNAYVAKTRAEVDALLKRGATLAGSAYPQVLFVKGILNDGEAQGGALLGGADGEALKRSLIRLGYAPQDWAALAATGDPKLVCDAVRVLDPTTVVVLDEPAKTIVREAFADGFASQSGLESAMFVDGLVVNILGMRFLSLGGFEAALADTASKQLMWARLKLIPPLGEPF
ncbi:MAG: hypothetical protein IJH87_01445 [Atopobiaceae bacterium]|nr:hypothetical protein [Atopobiaceae bacterium]